ncbi:hypothetical protein O181_080638 [Austropuccinia psidii MF-1]|uniref:Uncharacterized protein n=1 Tax=Austropuccinia psidii MF-1 TaxID=1389203 RepID=A0A9Q3IGQ1_9BASI|nr:hypothetical protein [Austropuccinia psidii MF-1]
MTQREIHKLGKASRISPRKPFLQPQDFQVFLVFTQEHRCWTIDDWEKVVWTNKSAFELGKKAHQVQVWHTPQDKWILKNLAVDHQSWYGGHFAWLNDQWANDFSRDGPTNLSASPASLCHPHEDCSMDNGFPLLNLHGGQHPNSHGKPQQPVAQTTWHQQNELASSFSRPQPH